MPHIYVHCDWLIVRILVSGECRHSLMNDPQYVIPNSAITTNDYDNHNHCKPKNARLIDQASGVGWCGGK